MMLLHIPVSTIIKVCVSEVHINVGGPAVSGVFTASQQ